MKFTRDVPTEDGWYWVLTHNGTVEIVSRVLGAWWHGEWMSAFDKLGVTHYGSRIETPEVEVDDE